MLGITSFGTPQSLQHSMLTDGVFRGVVVLPAFLGTLKVQHFMRAVWLQHVDNWKKNAWQGMFSRSQDTFDTAKLSFAEKDYSI